MHLFTMSLLSIWFFFICVVVVNVVIVNMFIVNEVVVNMVDRDVLLSMWLSLTWLL